VVCANARFGVCKKIVCAKCFVKHGWAWPEDGREIKCTHCAGACPSKARCFVYSRHNAKRKGKEGEAAVGEGEKENGRASKVSKK